MVTGKKPVTFYADDDVAQALAMLDRGKRTEVINAAIRQYLKIGETELERLAQFIETRKTSRVPLTPAALAKLIRKFAGR